MTGPLCPERFQGGAMRERVTRLAPATERLMSTTNSPHVALSGSRVLLTGGTTGIGRATAHVLVERGAHVLICGRDEDDLEEAMRLAPASTGTIDGVTADLSEPEGVSRLFEAVDDMLDGLDILINNAGIGGGSIGLMALDDLAYLVATNIFGLSRLRA